MEGLSLKELLLSYDENYILGGCGRNVWCEKQYIVLIKENVRISCL
jgi:hypothetical protein